MIKAKINYYKDVFGYYDFAEKVTLFLSMAKRASPQFPGLTLICKIETLLFQLLDANSRVEVKDHEEAVKLALEIEDALEALFDLLDWW